MAFLRNIGAISRIPVRSLPVFRRGLSTFGARLNEELPKPIVPEVGVEQKQEITIQELGQSSMFDKRIKKAFVSLGYLDLTPVQLKSIVPIVTEENGVVCRAKTGTGKTMAFVIPTVQTAVEFQHEARQGKGKVQALIIAPTRDLALQIKDEYLKLLHFDRQLASKCQVRLCIGGKSDSIYNAPQIVVATPGRLEANLRNPNFARLFSDLKYRIYDEADRLLDQGFEESLLNIDTMLKDARKDALDPTSVMKNVLFSATINKRVDGFATETIGSGYKYINCVDENEPESHENIHQTVVRTNNLLESHVAAVSDLFRNLGHQEGYKAILFVPTVSGTDFLHGLLRASESAGHFDSELLRKNKSRILKLHGQMSQAKRDQTTQHFRTCKSGVLVCTDVAARGLDFKNVTDVIQLCPSNEMADYVHKVGRTARAGTEGNATIYLSDAEYRYKTELERQRGIVFSKEVRYETFEEDNERILALNLQEDEVNDYIKSILGFYRGVIGSYRLDMRDVITNVMKLFRSLRQDPEANLNISSRSFQMMGLPRELADVYFDVEGFLPNKGSGNSRNKKYGSHSGGDYKRDGYNSGNKRSFFESGNKRNNHGDGYKKSYSRDSYSKGGDRDSYSKGNRDSYSRGDRDSYSKGGNRDSYSRGDRDSYSRGGDRDSYSKKRY